MSAILVKFRFFIHSMFMLHKRFWLIYFFPDFLSIRASLVFSLTGVEFLLNLREEEKEKSHSNYNELWLFFLPFNLSNWNTNAFQQFDLIEWLKKCLD